MFKNVTCPICLTGHARPEYEYCFHCDTCRFVFCEWPEPEELIKNMRRILFDFVAKYGTPVQKQSIEDK